MTLDHRSLSIPDQDLFAAGGPRWPRSKRKYASIRSLVLRVGKRLAMELQMRKAVSHVSMLDGFLLKDIGLEPHRFKKQLRLGRDEHWRNEL